MKFRTLEIHNIASIEDATINFDSYPLSDSEVFLITGKTGSGKSTILDAICLALFDNTPRLKNTNIKESGDDLPDRLRPTDTKQLMRKNRAEAWVNLTFVGNNNVDYQAKWYLSRARKKVDGKIQSVSRTLQRMSDDVTFTKVGEIEAELTIALGLDFDQFCRTTMLAQGQFTQFLNSTDKDKAAILEKITGLDIYKSIGIKVYEVTDNKRKDFEKAQSLKETVKVLTAEDVDAINANITTLSDNVNQLINSGVELNVKKNWIVRNNELTDIYKRCKIDFEEAQLLWNSSKVQGNVRLAARWNETIEPRTWYTSLQQSINDKNVAEQHIASLANDFIAAQYSLRQEVEQLDKIKNDLVRVQSELSSMTDKLGVIDKAQTISLQLKSISECETTISKLEKDISRLKKTVDAELAQSFKNAESIAQEKSEFEKRCKTELSQAEDKANAISLTDLRSEKEQLDKLHNSITLLSERLTSHRQSQQRLQKASEDNDRLKKTIDDDTLKLKGLEVEVEVAEKDRDVKKALLEQWTNTINKWAKQMRATLTLGDVCPVCGQSLQSELPLEAELDRKTKEVKAEAEEAEKLYNNLSKRYMALQSDIKSNSTQYDNSIKQYAAESAVLNANADGLIRDLAALAITSLVDAEQLLQQKSDKAMQEKFALEQKIANGEAFEREVKRLKNEVDAARSETEKARNAVNVVQKEIEKAENEAKTKTELIAQKQNDIASAVELVTLLMINSGFWRYNWQTDRTAFEGELTALVVSYKSLTEQSSQLSKDIDNQLALIGRAETMRNAVLTRQAHWAYLPNDNVVHNRVTNVETEFIRINTDVEKCTDKLLSAKTKIDQFTKQLDNFVAANNSYTLNDLDSLNHLSQKNIQELDIQTKNIKTDCDSRLALLESSSKALTEHQQQKPQLDDEETIKTLTDAIAAIELEKGECQQAIGSLKSDLEKNEKEKLRSQSLIDDADKAKDIYTRWAMLNDRIGSADGDKFRKIAQSYVLGSLVNAANSYMKTLAPRYTLSVLPGSFVIFIEDAFQGYARRATTTISGGESFLVSLSLALALSDIGQHLSVDTLFIDEGFGTLSGESLQNAINTLHSLHSRMGRHVGIISHVEELQERIPIQIKVTQEGNASSSSITIVPEKSN